MSYYKQISDISVSTGWPPVICSFKLSNYQLKVEIGATKKGELHHYILKIDQAQVFHDPYDNEVTYNLSETSWLSPQNQSINQSNFYHANIPSKARLSGTAAKSVFNSKI